MFVFWPLIIKTARPHNGREGAGLGGRAGPLSQLCLTKTPCHVQGYVGYRGVGHLTGGKGPPRPAGVTGVRALVTPLFVADPEGQPLLRPPDPLPPPLPHRLSITTDQWTFYFFKLSSESGVVEPLTNGQCPRPERSPPVPLLTPGQPPRPGHVLGPPRPLTSDLHPSLGYNPSPLPP